MRIDRFLAAAAVLFCLAAYSAAAAETVNYQPFELDRLIHEIEKPSAPVVTDDYIIFTADKSHRYVGIAFDFENFSTVHPFKVFSRTDDSGEKRREYLFYCYERQHRISELKYRLVIDGLWTADPLNPEKEYDDDTNLYFSKVYAPGKIRIQTETMANDSVRFIYKGDPGLDLRLAGNFTNWDPWIYQMNETRPGLYELELPLPAGKYYYTYYAGLTPLLDNTNPRKAYTDDGRSASVITVD